MYVRIFNRNKRERGMKMKTKAPIKQVIILCKNDNKQEKKRKHETTIFTNMYISLLPIGLLY